MGSKGFFLCKGRRLFLSIVYSLNVSPDLRFARPTICALFQVNDDPAIFGKRNSKNPDRIPKSDYVMSGLDSSDTLVVAGSSTSNAAGGINFGNTISTIFFSKLCLSTIQRGVF
jgi:hypothetical protein